MNKPTPKELREYFGWRQEDAARVFGVTRRTWQNWETTGNVTGPAALAIKLFSQHRMEQPRTVTVAETETTALNVP